MRVGRRCCGKLRVAGEPLCRVCPTAAASADAWRRKQGSPGVLLRDRLAKPAAAYPPTTCREDANRRSGWSMCRSRRFSRAIVFRARLSPAKNDRRLSRRCSTLFMCSDSKSQFIAGGMGCAGDELLRARLVLPRAFSESHQGPPFSRRCRGNSQSH
jgi:hypothetical protein